MKAMGTAALADPYATALQSRKSCCVLLVIFFIFCVALCFVAAARTDSEQNEEKYRKEMKKINTSCNIHVSYIRKSYLLLS